MVLKRSVSRSSLYNSSVTIYEPSSSAGMIDSNGADQPRRSKRMKSTSVLTEDMEDIVKPNPGISPKKRRGISKASSTPKKKKAIQMALEKPHPAPENWEEEYNAIREMRAKYVAPVDTMGCDTARLKEIDPKVYTMYIGQSA